MGFSADDIAANRRFFADKLRAYRQLQELVHKVKHDGTKVADFLLLDVRARDAFAKAHIPGALSVPREELANLAATLPRDRELVTYCWSHF
jgi:rhodanese-related sulfurtransferase